MSNKSALVTYQRRPLSFIDRKSFYISPNSLGVNYFGELKHVSHESLFEENDSNSEGAFLRS